MLDFQVAYDKLAQFETVDEIAEFLQGYGIKGYRQSATHCAISVFMLQTTGVWTVTGSLFINKELTTPAISHFTFKFDLGHYPELEVA